MATAYDHVIVGSCEGGGSKGVRRGVEGGSKGSRRGIERVSIAKPNIIATALGRFDTGLDRFANSDQ